MILMSTVCFDRQIFERQRGGGISRYFSELVLALQERSDIQILERKSAAILHATFYGGLPRHRRGQKLVSTLFDMVPERLPEFFPLSRLRERFGRGPHANKARWLEASDGIISISQASADDLEFFHPGLGSRINVIHLGSSLHRLKPEPVIAMQGRRFWLLVGKRASYKNGITILMALARLKPNHETPILFAAGGGSWTEGEQSWIKGHSLSPFVHQSPINDKQLVWLYQHAEAVVIPSISEGFSLPLIEALHGDTPVIASDIEAHREIAGDYATLLNPICTRDWTDLLASAIKDPLKPPSQILHAESLGRLKAHYSPERMASEHAATYIKLVS